jgi:hypothetical protein
MISLSNDVIWWGDMLAIPEYKTDKISTTESEDATCEAFDLLVIFRISTLALRASSFEDSEPSIRSISSESIIFSLSNPELPKRRYECGKFWILMVY